MRCRGSTLAFLFDLRRGGATAATLLESLRAPASEIEERKGLRAFIYGAQVSILEGRQMVSALFQTV
jgi:hypothetical protein